jgi:ppGpp synthetase/RelA/SpoT-type nucleotidyltranferase
MLAQHELEIQYLDLPPNDMARSWAVPHFKSKGEVNRAGEALIENGASKTERAEALSVINNWRGIHSYPLHIAKVNLKKRVVKIDEDAVCVQRLKRLPSITLKLKRNKNMTLTQMQDIGGCRAILPTMFDVRALIEVYEKAIAKNPPKKDKPMVRSELVERYPYIDKPKSDGYRSHHYVFKYRSTAADKQCYDGLRVEIQIRTKLQHAWATAVEAISTFTEQALKSGIGDARWKRFFALVGTAIALREGCPPVPDTPTDPTELKTAIRELFNELQVEMVLFGITATVQLVGTETGAQVYLLVLDADKKFLEVKPFKAAELVKASEEYLLVEEKYADNPKVQAVLVSADSLVALESGYPNYYLDTTAFLEAVRLAIADEKTGEENAKDARETTKVR